MKRKSKKILAAVMGLTLMSALSVGCQRQSEEYRTIFQSKLITLTQLGK